MMDIEVTNSPVLSVGEPPSVPSRISVVLVEEAKAGGIPRLGCPHVDQDIRLLAGVAKPANVTVGGDSHGSPCVGGTLSSSNITRRLLPVVPAGITFPAGPDGLYVAGGPVGPFGTLSPSDSEPAGSVSPYVAGGPVGPDGTLSPFIWPCWPIWEIVPVGLRFSDIGGLCGGGGGVFPFSDPPLYLRVQKDRERVQVL